MAKRYCTIIFTVLLFFFVGCQSGIDSGVSRLEPVRTGTTTGRSSVVSIADAGEIDIVEQVVVNREAYRQGLETLVRYYSRAGNDAKLIWANRELNALNVMPQYKYIIVTGASEEYRATSVIADADLLYDDALILENEAKFGPIVTNKDKLRLALDRYEQLIVKYPTSDKIDDAAYKSGEISEYFKDYTIALEYYQRAYQWDPDTPNPARFRAASILDRQMHRNAEALELYKEAVETEGRYGKYREWKDFAEERIKALEKTGD